jgi:hypothetical protein
VYDGIHDKQNGAANMPTLILGLIVFYAICFALINYIVTKDDK